MHDFCLVIIMIKNNFYLLQGSDLTPDELQIAHLEKCLAEASNNIDELHTSWMREQSRIVALTKQRNTLLNQLNVYHKRKSCQWNMLVYTDFK